MTLAPRVEVFTQLACQSVLGRDINYNHTHTHHAHSLRADISTSQEGPDIPEIIPAFILSKFDQDSDDGGINEPLGFPPERCSKDPQVQSVAARLQTTVVIVMGIVSSLTTGWWGHFGERHGRTRVMAVGAFGMLITDLTFAAISLPKSPFAPYGHALLVLAPFLEGLLGGWTSLQGATSAYVSDCTSDGSRSHIFSRFMVSKRLNLPTSLLISHTHLQGVFFFGFALGPVLGAWIIRHSASLLSRVLHVEPAKAGRSVTPVFWIAVILWIITVLLSIFVFPESLEKVMQKGNNARVAINSDTRDSENRQSPKATYNSEPSLLSSLRRVFVPLVVFAPKRRQNRKDWTMTLLAMALFGYLLSSVSEPALPMSSL